MNFVASILATAVPATPLPGKGVANGAASFFPIALMLGVVVFMLMTARSQKKRDKRERDSMHERMSKNDRVLTVGGVIGTIVQVKEDRVVLKVDESTNTKMTFTKSSIQKILSDDIVVAK